MPSPEFSFAAFLLSGAALYGIASVVLWIGALRRAHTGRDHPYPTVTVVIPARDEVRNIPALLAALARQTYPPDRWEAVLVNDRSKDGTDETARALAHVLPVALRIIRINAVPDGWSPKKHAITRAIAESTGEMILTTDADCRPEPGWIEAMVGALEGDGADLVAGYSPYGKRESLSGRLLALETLSQGFLAMSGIGIGRPITCQGRSFGYRRGVFVESGGFGEAHAMLSGDDHLFLQRAVRRGFRATYCDAEGAKVWTDPPGTWEQFVHQRIRMFSGGRKLSFGVAALGAAVYGWLSAVLVGMFALHPLAWAVFGLKVFLDAVSLAIAAHRLGEERLLRVYPLAALLYPPYFLVFAALGTFGSYRWKGARGA